MRRSKVLTSTSNRDADEEDDVSSTCRPQVVAHLTDGGISRPPADLPGDRVQAAVVCPAPHTDGTPGVPRPTGILSQDGGLGTERRKWEAQPVPSRGWLSTTSTGTRSMPFEDETFDAGPDYGVPPSTSLQPSGDLQEVNRILNRGGWSSSVLQSSFPTKSSVHLAGRPANRGKSTRRHLT